MANLEKKFLLPNPFEVVGGLFSEGSINIGGLMSSVKIVPEFQQSFEFESILDDYLSDSDEELLSLLEEVLTEIYQNEEDEESFDYVVGRAVYDIVDEKEIQARERMDQEFLDEGSPAVENLVELEKAAVDYFMNPTHYHLDEDLIQSSHVTGFIQIYNGERFDSFGKMKQNWKSLGNKLVVDVTSLLNPDEIIKQIELQGIKWSHLIRIVFYGHPLVDLVGSRFYAENESKEFVTLDTKNPNIILAIPDYSETETNAESIYDWINKDLQDGIALGLLPNVSRVTMGHWELTQMRLDELADEQKENSNLLSFVSREQSFVLKQNNFLSKYEEARSIIRGLNSGTFPVGEIYNKTPELLGDILFLAEKCSERIDMPAHYLQIKSLRTKLKIQEHLEANSPAFQIIQRINRSEPVEIHLLNERELQQIFDILWGNLQIKIIEDKKDIYLALKDRLLRYRSAKLRSPA